MATDVITLPADTVLALRPALMEIYHAVFTEPPYDESETTVRQFGRILEDHVRRPGFKCVVAVARDQADTGAIAGRPPEDVLGFAYGYTSRPGQWWYDAVARRLDPAVNASWMEDPFEVVELAVRPTDQSQGIGGRLHDALLEGLPHHTAVLSTAAAETPAAHLYRKRGWVILSDAFTIPGSSVPYVIMGLRLTETTNNTRGPTTTLWKKSPPHRRRPRPTKICPASSFARRSKKTATPSSTFTWKRCAPIPTPSPPTTGKRPATA